MHILLVDDNASVVGLLRRQLARLGRTDVAAYTEAAAALEFLREDPGGSDLILLDLQMPGIDGVQFVRHLADLAYSGGLVLMSGEDERILQSVGKLATAHRLDVRGWLRKPVSIEDLAAMIRGGDAPAQGRPAANLPPYGVDRFREGLERGELVNYYQPKVALATGQVVGVETLVRWRHPQDGLVFPDRFIALAEQNGLIDALTRAVLLGALEQARTWLDQGLVLKVAVNVSMENLTTLDFPDFVAQAVAAAGLAREAVSLEVTESRLMDDPRAALDVLTRLRLKHIGLSIDDFGTGHSSQAQLRDIPFEELKLDRGFVHGASRNPGLRAMLDANIRMAHQLGMWTVAEGVEDLEDWNLLREIGSDLAQGYFISRPLPGEAIPGWIAEWKGRRPALVGAA